LTIFLTLQGDNKHFKDHLRKFTVVLIGSPGMKKLLPLGLLAVLAFVPLAFATNESSYNYGLYSKYIHKCNTTCSNLDVTAVLICNDPQLDNMTACVDGTGGGQEIWKRHSYTVFLQLIAILPWITRQI
jgi:hypothetical protein